jgi:hypothetical protein
MQYTRRQYSKRSSRGHLTSLENLMYNKSMETMQMQPWCELHHRALQNLDTDCLKQVEVGIKGTTLTTPVLIWDLSSWWCPKMAELEELEEDEAQLDEEGYWPSHCGEHWIIKVCGNTLAGPRTEKYLLQGEV